MFSQTSSSASRNGFVTKERATITPATMKLMMFWATGTWRRSSSTGSSTMALYGICEKTL